MSKDSEQAKMIQEKYKQQRIEIRKNIHELHDELCEEYWGDLSSELLSAEAILTLATKIVMNEEEQYRHDDREANAGLMFGAMNN